MHPCLAGKGTGMQHMLTYVCFVPPSGRDKPLTCNAAALLLPVTCTQAWQTQLVSQAW